MGNSGGLRVGKGLGVEGGKGTAMGGGGLVTPSLSPISVVRNKRANQANWEKQVISF